MDTARILEYFAQHPGELTFAGINAYMLRTGATLSEVADAAGLTLTQAQTWMHDNDPTVYIEWLRRTVHDAGGRDRHYVPFKDEFGNPILEPGMTEGYGRLTPAPNTSVTNELLKYNSQNHNIDLAWGQVFLELNDYFEQGQFAPGSPTATLDTMAQAKNQWAKDAAPGMLDKVLLAAVIATVAYMTYGASFGAESITATVDSVPALADGYAEFYSGATLATPETITAAALEVAGSGTTATAATVAKTGMTAAQVLGSAKTVLGTAGTVATIAKMVAGSTSINPATGTPRGLPPGYTPIITPGESAGGLPLNYSGIFRQLAIPAAALIGIFLLKG